MKLGLVFPHIEIPDDPVVIRDYVQAAEAAGFDYLLSYDHVLGVNAAERPEWEPPLFVQDRSARSPNGTDDAQPVQATPRAPYDHESRFQEPLVLHAFLAGVTSTIELATGVVILPQRQTVLVAKQAANIANLSGGRLRLGVGIGWNDAEYEGLGADFKTRGRRIEEQMSYLRRLWSEETLTFTGEFHQIKGAGINPRPKQPIPLWVGGLSDIAMRRAARLGDGWQPVFSGKKKAAAWAAQFREELEAVGRDLAKVGLETVIECGTQIGGLVQTPEQAAENAGACREAGFSHCCISTIRMGHASMDEHLEFATRWLQMVR